jgi:hypothetical protein
MLRGLNNVAMIRITREAGTARNKEIRSAKAGRKGGVIAQLGERFNGIEEVGGSIPPGSTNKSNF